MSEVFSDNLSRFNDIIQSLPLRLRLKISSLCLLDNVSTQLLRLLVLNSSSPQIIEMLSEQSQYSNSGEGEIFQTLLKLFREIRLIYSSGAVLLSVHDVAPGLWLPNSSPPLLLRGHETYILTTIRKANLLTYVLTLLGCFHYGFEFLQDSFFEVFCPNAMFVNTNSLYQSGKLLKSQGILYLGLKTQAFISGVKELGGESHDDEISMAKRQQLLDMIFPDNLGDLLILRRTGRTNDNANELMTPSEREFIERCVRRKENLSQYGSYKSLTRHYDWSQFVKELLDYCHKNMGVIILGRKNRGKSSLYSFNTSDFDPQVLYASGAVNSEDVGPSPTAENTMVTANDGGATSSFASTVMVDHLSAGAKMSPQEAHDITKSIADAAVTATVNHSSTMVKKLKPKRTWSKDEEDALIEGLKEVGPSWSKILDLYGPGGKITESLKNRTQVQLKDKARNWKLQYLKSGRVLPEYLVRVTGTLERTFRSKKKNTRATPIEQIRDSSTASELFGTPTADTTGFDPNLESAM